MDELLLYHYSTGAGLLGMLKDYTKDTPNIKLWASHYMYMNDPIEYEIGEIICTEIIDKVETELNIPGVCRVINLVNTPDYREALNAYKQTYIGQSISPYLISLSKSCDSLHMWDMYASNGNGIAIVFNRLKLLESNVHLKDCIYYQKDDKNVIAKIEHDIRELYQELHQEYPLTSEIIAATNKGDYNLLCPRIHYIYTLICLFIGIRIKAKAYAIENEVRITPLKHGNTKILFRDRKGIIIPYIEYPIPFSSIEGIIVGPTADFVRVRESILIFLNSKGIEWDINKIIKSQVPYRI